MDSASNFELWFVRRLHWIPDKIDEPCYKLRLGGELDSQVLKTFMNFYKVDQKYNAVR